MNILQKKIFQKYNSDTNFVKFQNDIMNILKDFISNHTSKKKF